MSNPIEDLIAGFRDLVHHVPELVQPLIVAVAGAVPFVEGEGAATIGVIGGLNPFVAAASAIAGNLICVVLVVLLSSRLRTATLARKASKDPVAVGVGAMRSDSATESTFSTIEDVEPETKGRRRVRAWITRFGVPGASLIAPIAIPTPFTASLLVASGVDKRRVIFWQAVAIVLWTSVVTAASLGVLAAVEV